MRPQKEHIGRALESYLILIAVPFGIMEKSLLADWILLFHRGVSLRTGDGQGWVRGLGR